MNVEPIRSSDTVRQWFAIRVKSRCEKMVASIARNKGIEEFLPLYYSRRRRPDRFKTVELPLFPGYVFCRLDPQYRLPLLVSPGVLHFVGIGKLPAPIDDEEMSSIQCVLRSGSKVEPWPFLQVGQRVSVEYGPLAGVEGLLIEAHKQHRVVVSVMLLRRSVAAEIERDWVRPVLCRHTPPPFAKVPTSVSLLG